LLHEKNVAESPCRLHLDGIRFYSGLTRTRPRPVFDLVSPRHIQKQPVVWSPRGVRGQGGTSWSWVRT
jgi:hypothetical protein